MDLLWPRVAPQSARNNLNVAISGLRRSLESAAPGTYVVHHDGSYSLASHLDLWTDVTEFESARRAGNRLIDDGDDVAAREHLERALELYRGPLFEDSDAEWLHPDRRLIEERYVAMQERLAALYLRCHDDERALETGHAILRVEPCRETAHQLLMRAYAAQGQYHLAARQYAECVTALERDFGIAPHPDTTAIFRDLLSAHTSAQRPPRSPRRGGVHLMRARRA